jgi:flavin reductase (DIM6/NTAB) family NADH-FMN oxidoreductase RutF
VTEPLHGQSFRDALARFASGVTVVAAQIGEQRVGLTATAFSSLSLDPPLVLVCVAHGAGVHDAIVAADGLGISVLASHQSNVALQFAKRGVDRFEGVALVPDARVPLIDGALAHLACRRHALYEAGDHTIVVAEVISAHARVGEPLLHFERQFGGFLPEPPRPAPARSPQITGGA